MGKKTKSEARTRHVGSTHSLMLLLPIITSNLHMQLSMENMMKKWTIFCVKNVHDEYITNYIHDMRALSVFSGYIYCYCQIKGLLF